MEALLLVPPGQAVDTAVTAYDFWLSVIDRLTPILTPLAIAAAAYLTWLTKRDVREAKRELAEVHEKVNGTASELRKVTERAAHAEGVVEGATAVAPAMLEAVKQVASTPAAPPPRDPAQRTRASDRPTEPAPPEPPPPYDGPPL